MPTAVRIVRDAEEIQESVGGGGSFRRYQVSCGPFLGKLEALSCPRTAFFSGRYTQDLRVTWRSPQNDYLFGLYLGGRGKGHFNRRPLSGQNIALFGLGGEIDAFIPIGVTWLGFKIPPSLLEGAAEAGGLSLTHFAREESWMKEGEPEAFDNLTQTVRAILDTGGVVNDSRSGSLTEYDEEDLLDAFVSCFKKSDDHPPVDRWRNRFRIARQADDYLRAHLNRSVTAAELCRELRVSRRLLYYAMTDVFQCSPVSYHRRRRLNLARIDLRDRSKHLSVSEAARRWGFNNMGHFSRYYREMFAELPSVTAQSG